LSLFLFIFLEKVGERHDFRVAVGDPLGVFESLVIREALGVASLVIEEALGVKSLVIGEALGVESLVIGEALGLVIGLVIGLEIGLEIEINDGLEGESYVIGKGLDLLEGEDEVSGEIGDNLDLDLDLEFLLSGEGERLGVESLI
jgi:hypothetical protein